MRIIGGKWRGRRLADVGKGDASAHLRPTSDRVRESLFNSLFGGRFGDPVTGARVLDLFSGTGALALEALSRGAESATLVDNGKAANRLIHTNIETLGAQDQTEFLRRDATHLGSVEGEPFDLVFLDPPYGKGLGHHALLSAKHGNWLADDAFIVWEEDAAQSAPSGFELIESRRYGDTHVTFLRRQTDGN